MRLVIDMQGAQSASRFRGIGRYTLSLVQEMARQLGEHEILLALNAAYSDTIEPIRAAFAELLPADAIRVFEVAGSVGSSDAANDSSRKAAEIMLDAFYSSLYPDVVFIPSLIEGFGDDNSAVTCVHSINWNIPTAIVIYDLIPRIYPDYYLTDLAVKRWYLQKINQLSRADLLLSISESSKREAMHYIGFSDKSVINISCGCDSGFKQIQVTENQRAYLRKTYGIDKSFVLCAGDADVRKNVDGLIRAYASLDLEMRSTYLLVLLGRGIYANKNHLMTIAKGAGLLESDLCFTGYVSDADLILLYNACSLFVFPSWHEGFGLPVLEAMACGTAVIAANSSSLPEVVGRQDALFTPRDDDAIAAKMAEVLQNPEFRKELERHGLEQAKKFSWAESANRAWKALSQLYAEHSAQKGAVFLPAARRSKLAFVSPLPPEKTGIADYSAELLPELARHYDITVIVQQELVSDAWVHTNSVIRDTAWLRQNAHKFDRVLYQFGNSPFHDHMFDLLAVIPGVVVLHDFYLSWPVWHRDEHGRDKHSWARALLHGHGWNAVRDRFAVKNWNDVVDVVAAYPCNLSVLQQALGIIVHSDFSRKLARQFYGDQSSKDWILIPHLRQPAALKNKTTTRQKLGISPQDFVVCSFGMLAPTKLNQRLLDAWLASPLASQSHCYLIYVGENDCDSEYGKALVQTITQSIAKDRIQITGWASTEAYQDWLEVADMAVQLRTMSRGENSGTVLDCMNYGLPTIVNAHGSLAEFPENTVWMLADNFTDEELIEALTALWHNGNYREKLSQNAKDYIYTHHNPRQCAEQYFEAIESRYEVANRSLYGLSKELQSTTQPLSENKLITFARVLSANFPPLPRKRQLLIDISAVYIQDLGTGIQRVVRALLKHFLINPPEGMCVEPVFANTGQTGFFYARQFASRFLDMPDKWAENSPVQVWPGDVFFCPDFATDITVSQESCLQVWRNRGVRIYFVVYDLLPVLMPEVFPDGAKEGHHRWLQTITRMDGALCISRSVADELHDWLQTFGEKRERPFAVDWFHLGADVDNSNPSRGLPSDAPQTLRSLADRPSFLMVGTIEPRKGVLQTLHAFDQLWEQGVDCNLVIVGKEGWKPVPEHQRGDIPQTVQALRTHFELGKRLFWLEGISDEYLEQIYSASTCLIAASYGEGFGLPLIEAARHGLPLLVRDIPVFREVTAGYAQFFSDTRQPEAIAEATLEWLALYQQGKHPRSDALPHITWAESSRKALDIVLGNTPPYRTWLPDGVRRYWGADPRLHSHVGRVQGHSIQTTDKQGFLLFGPYENFVLGQYQLTIQGKAERWTGEEWLDIACDKGEHKLLHYDFIRSVMGLWKKSLVFTLDKDCIDLEVRLWVSESSILVIDEIKLHVILESIPDGYTLVQFFRYGTGELEFTETGLIKSHSILYNGGNGYLIYGPYLSLKKGNYIARLYYKENNPVLYNHVADIEIVGSKNKFFSCSEIYACKIDSITNFDVLFTLDKDEDALEVRVRVGAGFSFEVFELKILEKNNIHAMKQLPNLSGEIVGDSLSRFRDQYNRATVERIKPGSVFRRPEILRNALKT